jgi:hypothetical protein
MVVIDSRKRLVVVTDKNVADMERSLRLTQRNLHRMRSDPAKSHWWPRFLRWWCGVKEDV